MTQIKLSHMSASSRLKISNDLISNDVNGIDEMIIEIQNDNIEKGTKRSRDENGGDNENENDINQDSSTSEGSIYRKKALKKR